MASLPTLTDKRWRLLETTMKRHQYRSDGLIEVLYARVLGQAASNPVLSTLKYFKEEYLALMQNV